MSSSDSLQSFPTEEALLAAEQSAQAGVSPSGVTDALTLRQLSNVSGFVQIVTCYSGCITLLRGSEGATSPFVKVLSGSPCEVTVDARLGIRELHVSEVSIVGAERPKWRANTVAGVLQAAGATDEDVAHMMILLELGRHATSNPDELAEAERRRLELACALFSKTHILLFMQPFAGQTAKWVQTLSSLLVEAARQSSQKYIVVGVGAIPPLWRASDVVHVESLETSTAVRKRDSADSAPSSALLSRGPGNVRPPSVMTRPQYVSSTSKSTSEETLQTEAIVNPNLVELLPGASSSEAEEVKPSGSRWTTDDPNRQLKATGRKGKDSGSHSRRRLTEISHAQRIYRTSPIFAGLRSLSKRVKAFFNESRFEDAALRSVRIEASRKRYRLERAIGYCALAMLLLTACFLVSRGAF